MNLPEDPRRLNYQFDPTTIEAHVRAYAESLSRALLSVDWLELSRAIGEIQGARTRGARVWVAGNGGSAAIADHLLCDWVKGTFTRTQPPIHVHSLASSAALLTACVDEYGSDAGFSRQIELLGQPGDVLICISLSGDSTNILGVLDTANSMGIRTIAVTGFSGGDAARIADISVHVAAHNDALVANCHQILMHNVAQYIYGCSA